MDTTIPRCQTNGNSATARFGIDGWKYGAIKVNLLKVGTTHTFLFLNFLTGGTYFPEEGSYRTRQGNPRFYFCSDNLKEPEYKGLTPQDLFDIITIRQLTFDPAREEGVLFHLIGALSPFGKLGLLAIGSSPENALQRYDAAVTLLKKDALRRNPDKI